MIVVGGRGLYEVDESCGEGCERQMRDVAGSESSRWSKGDIDGRYGRQGGLQEVDESCGRQRKQYEIDRICWRKESCWRQMGDVGGRQGEVQDINMGSMEGCRRQMVVMEVRSVVGGRWQLWRLGELQEVDGSYEGQERCRRQNGDMEVRRVVGGRCEMWGVRGCVELLNMGLQYHS